uniref:C3H1-type domain-containing protein n=1 Tax=Meloidogyne hapla TaxID=6305 RepID=A0A1I8AXP4_MELHA
MNITTEETSTLINSFPSTFSTQNFTLNKLTKTTLINFQQKRDVSFHFSLIFGSLIGGVTIVGLTANILVVIAILSDRKMRKSPMNLLLLNLAIADLLYLLAFTPFWLSMSVYGDGGWHFSDMFCPIARFFGNIFLVISILTYLAICIERYVAIVHPIAMHTSVWCTRSRVLVIAFGIWVFAMAYQFPYLVVFQVFNIPEKHLRVCRNPLASKSKIWKIYKWSEFLLTYALPIIISVLLYSRICRVLWSKSSKNGNNGKGQNENEIKSELKQNINKRPSGKTIKKVLETRFREAISDVQNKRKVVPKEENFNNSSEKRKTMNVVSSANLSARRSVVKMLMGTFAIDINLEKVASSCSVRQHANGYLSKMKKYSSSVVSDIFFTVLCKTTSCSSCPQKQSASSSRAVKQTDESINEVEGRLWSFDGTINTTNILGSKETTTGPKNPELYKTQWCRNILSKGICNFGDECWFAHDSSELRSAPQLNKTTNAVPLFNLASSALYNRRVGRF